MKKWIQTAQRVDCSGRDDLLPRHPSGGKGLLSQLRGAAGRQPLRGDPSLGGFLGLKILASPNVMASSRDSLHLITDQHEAIKA